MAAGFRLERGKQGELIKFLTDRLAAPVLSAATMKRLPFDGTLSARGATLELMDLIERAGPYGSGHPEPRFAFPAHRLARVRVIKDAHIRCTLQAQDGARLDACAFRVSGTEIEQLLLRREGQVLHVAGHLRRVIWQGRESVELLIEDAASPQND